MIFQATRAGPLGGLMGFTWFGNQKVVVRNLLGTQYHARIYFRGSSRGNIAGEDGNCSENHNDSSKRDWM